MKIWYKAVCDKHKEMIDLFINNVATTYHYFYGSQGEHNHIDAYISSWLKTHYGCSLRLIHNDVDLDKCFNAGYKLMKPREHKI